MIQSSESATALNVLKGAEAIALHPTSKLLSRGHLRGTKSLKIRPAEKVMSGMSASV